MNISLSAIPSPLTLPILEGDIKIDGLNIKVNRAKSVDRNSRDMLDGKFDIAEMSFATFLKAREDGLPLIGIPIFTGRRFLQPCISFSKHSGIRHPGELGNKRVGLPQYWMTSSVWHRGILQHEYGVFPKDVTWQTCVNERLESLRFPEDVRVELRESDLKGLKEQLENGEIDALLSPRPAPRDSTSIEVPFDDIVQTQLNLVKRTEILPIMHFVVMREEIEQQLEGTAANVLHAFQSAKELVYKGTYKGVQPESPIEGLDFEEARVVFNGDPWPYDLGNNKKALGTFLDYAI
jgi:4,5-dihydroxyphthalate decarboxylase